ncbi:uncharacterized protein TOT_020000036 [Theileria orientalis strain Shintoku]|uniref:PIPK domain-containing protein n=1 Tax=Theileria orientalis strain Shintoku TaxID=869250 RepID=J4D6T4_THEOR|nr:uncharacterized protein TOT_020000036 [Theileria orientalis strain Shintoku]BAM39765.1 uncharacterized protein TOT_020000036 [Theileria orientalis strain Shintoku]|eukprot:XP_009690066.1 uncharacterized protein TOT_020000036 [Theileria orientalis strain Shintoku]
MNAAVSNSGKSQKGMAKICTKLVNKSVGIHKNKNSVKQRGCVDYNSRIQLYGEESEELTRLDSMDLEIDENMLKVCKIYLKQSLYNDCKLVKLNPNYVEHIVELIFNLGFLAKRGHFMRDILDLINLLEVPESVLNLLGMNRNHRLSIFKGVAFRGELSHPEMKTELKRLCENYVPNDAASLLSAKSISCISKVGSKVMNKLSFALNCGIMHSPDKDKGIEKCIGECEKFCFLSRGVTIATLTFAENFKGFTIFISKRMIKSENLRRIEELIKISIVRLQGIVEELELIKNLNGTFEVDTKVFERDHRQSSVCENFSDYLDTLLGNKPRGMTTPSPRSTLNYFSCEMYYNKVVESEISCSEYRKLTRLQCFKYYTKMNELCTTPSFETVPIGRYAEGEFLSDFIGKITNALKINKCVASQSCSESYINHQLHFETAYSNVENMRLSLTFQMASEKYAHQGINVKTFCSKCNHSSIHSVQDLTLGRFLQLLMFNRAYRAKCDHALFQSSKFSVLAESYSITFNLSPVSIYKVAPEFNEPYYNCTRDTMEVLLRNGTMLDRRLQLLSNKVESMVHRPQGRRVYDTVTENLHNLVNYDIERRLPCICRLRSPEGESGLSRSQWVSSIEGLKFEEFIRKFERHSAFGIELNHRLYEKIKGSMERGAALHACEECGANSYTTVADVDLLNWLYILVHVINSFESKIVKLKAGLEKIMSYSEEIAGFCRSVERAEKDLIGVFEQCTALMVYHKHFCPREPMHAFTVAKAFFVGFYNVFESLEEEYSAISHVEKVASVKIVEYDKTNVVIVHSFGKEAASYEKIDFTKIEGLEKEEEEDTYTAYNIDEFLTFSQYFAVLSGIEDLASKVKKKSAYFRMVSKIRLKREGNQSIICEDYKPIVTPNRDVANILSNALLKYTEYMREWSPEYEEYESEDYVGGRERRRGLFHDQVSLRILVGSVEKCIFKLEVHLEEESGYTSRSMELKKIYTTKNWENLSKFDDIVLKTLFDSEGGSAVRTKVKLKKNKESEGKKWKSAVPFYGLPIIYTNSNMLNYKRMDMKSEDGDHGLWEESNGGFDGKGEGSDEGRMATSYKGSEYLSSAFIKNAMKLSVEQKMLIKYIVANNSSVIIGDGGGLTGDSVEVNGVNAKSESEVLDVYWGPYRITVFYGREFEGLRKRFCGDLMNYARSLCRSTRMRSTGKSGSPIFMTYDGNYTIKLINKYEIGLFIAQGREFFEYFKKNETLMSLPYGLYKVTHLKTNSSINCFVMQNIDHFHNESKISFDLKGIALKRYISISRESVTPTSLSTTYNYAHSSFSDSEAKGKEGEGKDQSVLMSSGGSYVLLDQNFKLYTKGCPIQLNYESINLINERLKSDLNFLSSINIVDYSMLLRISPSQSVITLGIIDFLRPYTWDKQIETVGKRLANIGQEPTIVSPNEYKTRFFNFIQRTFVYPYGVRGQKESPEPGGQRATGDNINYMYQIRPYRQCRQCSAMRYMYSNEHFACLKYYMALLSPEVMQYLHLVMREKGGETTRSLEAPARGGFAEGPGKREAHRERLDRLVSAIERAYQSPTINWSLVI